MTRVFALAATWLVLGCSESDAAVADIDVAAGTAHACALDELGRVRCWGSNRFGAAGDGPNEHRLAPVAIADLPRDVVAIDAQAETTCALTGAGELWCWGHNHHGQLGNGSIADIGAPAPVSGLADVRAFSVGWAHTCAIDARDALFCWGFHASGQLGIAPGPDATVPTRVESELAPRPVTIEAGHTASCALDADGVLRCWGDEPARPIEPIPDAVDVASGADHTLVVLAPAEERDGSILAYGFAPGGLALEPPADGWALPEVARVVANMDHACALRADGALFCWGKNDESQLGDGTVGLRRDPTAAQPDLRFSDVAVGAAHTCAVTLDGRAICWGSNDAGQLGDGTGIDSRVPVEPR